MASGGSSTTPGNAGTAARITPGFDDKVLFPAEELAIFRIGKTFWANIIVQCFSFVWHILQFTGNVTLGAIVVQKCNKLCHQALKRCFVDPFLMKSDDGWHFRKTFFGRITRIMNQNWIATLDRFDINIPHVHMPIFYTMNWIERELLTLFITLDFYWRSYILDNPGEYYLSARTNAKSVVGRIISGIVVALDGIFLQNGYGYRLAKTVYGITDSVFPMPPPGIIDSQLIASQPINRRDKPLYSLIGFMQTYPTRMQALSTAIANITSGVTQKDFVSAMKFIAVFPLRLVNILIMLPGYITLFVVYHVATLLFSVVAFVIGDEDAYAIIDASNSLISILPFMSTYCYFCYACLDALFPITYKKSNALLSRMVLSADSSFANGVKVNGTESSLKKPASTHFSDQVSSAIASKDVPLANKITPDQSIAVEANDGSIMTMDGIYVMPISKGRLVRPMDALVYAWMTFRTRMWYTFTLMPGWDMVRRLNVVSKKIEAQISVKWELLKQGARKIDDRVWDLTKFASEKNSPGLPYHFATLGIRLALLLERTFMEIFFPVFSGLSTDIPKKVVYTSLMIEMLGEFLNEKIRIIWAWVFPVSPSTVTEEEFDKQLNAAEDWLEDQPTKGFKDIPTNKASMAFLEKHLWGKVVTSGV